jgi:hypothetical protein
MNGDLNFIDLRVIGEYGDCPLKHGLATDQSILFRTGTLFGCARSPSGRDDQSGDAQHKPPQERRSVTMAGRNSLPVGEPFRNTRLVSQTLKAQNDCPIS